MFPTNSESLFQIWVAYLVVMDGRPDLKMLEIMSWF